jgi:hypothetical protein
MRYRWIVTGVVVLLVAGIWFAHAGQKPRVAKEVRGGDSALVKHGEYLVTAVVLCGDCHTPQGKNGKPDRTRLLQGARLTIKPKNPTKDWVDPAPDITRSGLAGMWSEADMEARVRPTLELLLTESPAHLQRKQDPESGLALIRL